MEERIPLLERVFRLLEGMPAGGLSFTEIQKFYPGVPSSTVSRLLKALQAEEILLRDAGGGYRLAERLQSLARRVAGLVPRQELIRPVLEGLARRTGESAAYFEPLPDGAVLLAKFEIPEAFHYMEEGGSNRNLSTHGFNRLLHEPGGPPVRTNLRDDKPLVMRVAARVEGRGGEVIGALGVSFYCEALTAERRTVLEREVLAAAQAAGRELTGRESK